jgi:hypothetical protein
MNTEFQKTITRAIYELNAFTNRKSCSGEFDMKQLSLIWCCCVFFAGNCAMLGAAELSRKPTGDEAQAVALKWLDGLDMRGLVLFEKRTKDGFVMGYGPSALGRVTTFRLQQPGWMLSFMFKGEITKDTPLEEVRKQFWRVALNRLPTPGLELPGWEVRPQTPVSSFTDGVEILAFGDGNIKLRVKTEFFALYGRDPSVLVPADAASPQGSYFQIRKKFPLDLTLEAPFTISK